MGTSSKPQQKQKPQTTKSLNPFEKLMETLKEMEQSVNAPEAPPKAKPVKKNVFYILLHIDSLEVVLVF